YSSIERKFTIYVDGSSPYHFYLEPTCLPDAQVGKPYEYQLLARQGTTPYTWSATGLPSWLTLDSQTGILRGKPSSYAVGNVPFQVTVTDAAYPKESDTRDFNLYVNPTLYSAAPVISLAENSSGEAGIYVGLKDICEKENYCDQSGKVLPDAKLAGYQITLHYPSESVRTGDPIVVSSFVYSMFNYYNDSDSGTLTITDASPFGTTDYSRLFFVPLVITGSAGVSQYVYASFDDLSIIPDAVNNDPEELTISNASFSLNRGKIINPSQAQNYTSGSSLPKVADAIGGLQYLADQRPAGRESGQVNVINMASIVPTNDNRAVPGIGDVVTLLQYLTKMRDDTFQLSVSTVIGIDGLVRTSGTTFTKSVDMGTSLTLPSSATVKLSDGTTEARSITWSNPNPPTASSGQNTISGSVSGYAKSITLLLTVNNP
ncbi:MAG: putative Ig domain-containing protein, partial [Desulfosporosinus sp.]